MPAERSRAVRTVTVVGWCWAALSTLVLVVFTLVRAAETFGTPAATDSFGARYVEHPVIAAVHILPGLLFLLLAPVQFAGPVRRSRPRLHRVTGRVLLAMAVVSGLLAVVLAVALPAFAGLSTATATFAFGAWFLVTAGMAARTARARRIVEHRRWIVRLYAVGLGVATIRLVLVVGQTVTGRSFDDVFGAAFWAGFAINAVAAELWLRAAPRPAPARRRGRRPAARAS